MKLDVDSIVPKATVAFTSKVLFLEVYFLLRAGKSPAYFSLTDFIQTYSIEILYIVILLSLLAGWLIGPVFLLYFSVAGGLSWAGSQITRLARWQGTPVFSELSRYKRENSVSIAIARDYAHANCDGSLEERIAKYDEEVSQKLQNEMLAAANFALVVLIALVTHFTQAPNFLMKITSFADGITGGRAYEACLTLLVFQGVLGRALCFHLLRDSGSLPPDFFRTEDERRAVAAWVNQVVKKHEPLAKKWTGNQ